MLVSEFDFDLPADLVAQSPAERGASRLLVLDRASGAVSHHTIGALPDLLTPGDLLVVNNTRVFPARLLGHRAPSGGAVECLLLGGPDGERWDALVHPGQKLRPGGRMVFERGGRRLHGEILERQGFGRRTVLLWTEDGSSVASAIDAIGHMPLPPYIKRPDQDSDLSRYQTVYAQERGSVAAPTAGLHFTEGLLARLTHAGIARAEVTLHVGYGTFKPVRVERVEDHVVDAESYVLDVPAARALTAARETGRRVIAVGTTTTRVLETIAAAGGTIEPAAGTTGLFIHPGFSFRLVEGLLTNFHLPRSSLLMLVCAFGGRDAVISAYREAVSLGYRFYSYGDAMLIL